MSSKIPGCTSDNQTPAPTAIEHSGWQCREQWRGRVGLLHLKDKEKATPVPSEPAVAQPGIWFLFRQFLPVDIVLEAGGGHRRVRQRIADVVGRRAPNEELNREILKPLRVDPVARLACLQAA